MEFGYIGIGVAVLLFLIGLKVAKWLMWILAIGIIGAVAVLWLLG